MKKVLYAFILILLLIFVSYFWRYSNGICVCNKIPQDAEAVVAINTRNFEKYFLLDAVTHPGSYFSKDNSSSKDSTETPKVKGETKPIGIFDVVDIPSSFFMFKQSNGQWLSSDLSIKSIDKLDKLMEGNGFVREISNEDIVFTKENQKAFVTDNMLKFSYELDGFKESSKIIPFVPLYQSKGDVLFDALQQLDGDFLFVDRKKQHLQLSFDDGAINVNGHYNVEFLKPVTEILVSGELGELSASMDLNKIDQISSEGMKENFKGITKLKIDSLKQYWDGSLSVSLYDLKASSDTIKTYEYDDDFNKIEVVKVKKGIVPDFNARLGMSEKGKEYLFKKKAIVEDNGDEILAINPLVRTYCTQASEHLLLYTQEERKETENSSFKFKAQLDLQKLREKSNQNLYGFEKALQPINSFDISISNDNQVKAKIKMTDDRNALVSLLKRN